MPKGNYGYIQDTEFGWGKPLKNYAMLGGIRNIMEEGMFVIVLCNASDVSIYLASSR